MKRNNWFLLALLIPALFIFKSFYLPGPLAWGDAPYYTKDALRELFTEPLTWTNPGSLGNINELYWIYPLTFIIAILSKFLNLESDMIVRLLFYFPSLLGSLIFPILFVRYLGLPKIVQFFSSLVYTYNTYYLLLVDGGQVGVALAYGIFPLSLLYLRKLVDKPKIETVKKSLTAFVILIVCDARVAIICLFTLVLMFITEWISKDKRPTQSHLKSLLFFSVACIFISSYWLIPVLKLLPNTIGSQGTPSELSNILNGLFLFQPHWPHNEFGKTSPVPFYFVGIPLLVFGSLLGRKKQMSMIVFCYLIFVFLTKGTTAPFGFLYEFLTTKIPLGVGFRDSSKFFIPTILFAGILIGESVNNLYNLTKNRYLKKAVLLGCTLYLFLLISPAVAGKLNGVLAGGKITSDLEKINLIIEKDTDGRTLWFPEHHPWSYSTTSKPAVDAKSLVNHRTFASINVGTYNRFNFLHNDLSSDFLRLYGFNNIILSGDTRKKLSKKEKGEWEDLQALVDGKPSLEKYPNIDPPVYKVLEPNPRIFGTQKMIFVVGSDNIYKKLILKNDKFSPSHQPFAFIEDGKFEPIILKDLDSTSALLVFNDKNKIDFSMSFLQSTFVSPLENSHSEWAVRSSDEFLKWQYELLNNNHPTEEFDYNKGVAFSTETGEKISFKRDIKKTGQYVLAIRSLGTNPLKIYIDNQALQTDHVTEKNFSWFIYDGLNLTKGEHGFTFENTDGFHVINTFALIPQQNWTDAQSIADGLITQLPLIEINGDNLNNLEKITPNISKIDFETINSTFYKLLIPPSVSWIIFTDSFNQMWSLHDSASIPAYSAVNAFYTEATGRNVNLKFNGQKYARWGVLGTTVSILTIIAILLWPRSKN